MLNTAQFVSFSDLLNVSGIQKFITVSDVYLSDVVWGNSKNIYTLTPVDYVLDRLITQLIDAYNLSEEDVERMSFTVRHSVHCWIADLCREDGKALPSNIYVDMEN